MVDRVVEPAGAGSTLTEAALDSSPARAPAAGKDNGAASNGDRQADLALGWGRDYLSALRQQTNAPPHAPVLWFCGETWYAWTGARWQAVSDDHQQHRLVRFLQGRGEAAKPGLMNAAMLNLRGLALLDEPEAEPPLYVHRVEPLEIEPRPALAMRNGVLDLAELAETGRPRLRPNDPCYFTLTYMDYAYDPRATCPRWKRCVEQMLPRHDERDRRREVLQDIFASMLLSDLRLEKMFAFVGEGANGKSTTLDVLEAMLGHTNVSHVGFDDLGQRFRLEALRGKLANVSRETNPRKPTNEALLKALISGESVNTDQKYRDPRDLPLKARLLLACNRLPPLSDTSHGMWRRLLVLPFNERFEGERKVLNLAQQLIGEELPGILNWALSALPRLIRRGRFTDCSLCQAALDQHRRASDPVQVFFDACCEADPATGIERDKLYQLFCRYCRTRLDRSTVPVGKAQFGQRLRDDFNIKDPRPTKADGSRVRLYQGVNLSREGAEMLENEVLGQRPG